MVLMASKLCSTVYEIYNDQAEPLGEIRRPLDTSLLGFGQGTVFLDRAKASVRLATPAT